MRMRRLYVRNTLARLLARSFTYRKLKIHFDIHQYSDARTFTYSITILSESCTNYRRYHIHSQSSVALRSPFTLIHATLYSLSLSLQSYGTSIRCAIHLKYTFVSVCLTAIGSVNELALVCVRYSLCEQLTHIVLDYMCMTHCSRPRSKIQQQKDHI